MIKKALRFIFCCITFAAGFFLMAWGLGRVFTRLDEFIVREKVMHFAKNRDAYDTLFLGSSRVYHQISPAIFDAMAREGGTPTRSFNFGMDGLFPPEDSYLFEHILSLRPKNLRWVFVEVSMFLPDWSEKNSESPRAIYWHDWTRTSMAVREVLQGAKKFEWRKRKERWENWMASLDRCEMHIRMFAQKVTGLGGGGRILRDFLKGKQSKGAIGLGDLQDGYVPLGAPKKATETEFRYDEQYAKRIKKPVQYRPVSPIGQENFDRLLGEIRKAGATPVLVVSPAMSLTFFVPREPASEIYLDFADVYTWAGLYRKEHFVDAGHLSTQGAEIYTRYVTEKWLEAIRSSTSQRVAPAASVTSTLDAQARTP